MEYKIIHTSKLKNSLILNKIREFFGSNPVVPMDELHPNLFYNE